MKRIFKYLKSKKGITLVFMAFMLVVLLMLAGLAIDIAYMYYVKNQLQVAADAAALAGAAKLEGCLDDGNITSLCPTLPHYSQTDARQEAWKFACKNRAANQSVFLVTNSSTNCDAPPASDLNETSNTSTGDIVVGNWNSSTRIFTPATGSTGLPINALQARPRRTNETPGMPRVSLFIGQIFSLIGADWSAMSAGASAIAAVRGVLGPIVVNEYWYTDNPALCSHNPNCYKYPHSYFRTTNVGGTASLNYGNTLAIAGENANPNNSSADKGGFVGLDYRVDSYDEVSTETWYKMTASGLNPIIETSVDPKVGDWAPYLDFYPYDYPITITENYLTNYPTFSGEYLTPGTSTTPFATIAYITGIAVGQTIGAMIDNGNYRNGRYRPGKVIAILVYDGLRQAAGTTKRVTVVGYAGVRIVGYGNSLSDAQSDPFDKNANSCYAYAVAPLTECHTAAECEALVASIAPGPPRLVK